VRLAPPGQAERRFVREALLGLGSERAGLRDAARGVRDWDRALALARAGSVAESVWAGVSLRGVEGEIPEPARSAFQEAHAGATARNALLLSEAAEVQAALTAAGIESVVLKGPGLLVAHYPDIGGRHVGDVDVLVRERDAARAEEEARRIGALEPAPTILYDGTEDAHRERGRVHDPLLLTRRGVALEMHHHLPGGADDGSDVEGVLARSRAVEWQGRALRIPSAADLGAIACLHVFDHHRGDEIFLARHLADLAVVVGAGGSTWEEVAARVPPGEGRAALQASRRLLEAGPPGRLGAWRRAVGLRTAHWAGVFARAGASPEATFRILFPARPFMAARYRVSERSPLFPLLYLWRPVRGIWALGTGR
jgi:hypothetical protein